MTQQNKDKEIMGEVQYLYARQQSFTETWEVVENRVKQLIQQAREEERREVVEEIKKDLSKYRTLNFEHFGGYEDEIDVCEEKT